MTTAKFVTIQFFVGIGEIGIWALSGNLACLFVAGIASGAAIVATVLSWEERKATEADIRSRIDA